MRPLLDESAPSRFRRPLSGHALRTVGEMGWSGAKDGKLLALAATEFDAFVTVDKKLPYQQNLSALPVAVVVLNAVSNELPALLSLVPELERQLSSFRPRTYVQVKAGEQCMRRAQRRGSSRFAQTLRQTCSLTPRSGTERLLMIEV